MKKLLACGTAAVGCLALSACSSLAATEDRLGELLIAVSGDASSFDPATGNSGNDHMFLYPVFDTLIDFDPETTEPRPGLAQSWEYTDPQTLVLSLNDGIEFHDGETLDAEAVKANLDRSRSDGSNLQSELSSISEVNALDELTVEIELSEPDLALPLIFSDRAGMMVSPEALESPDDLASVPVGTGPWKLREWRNGSSVEYVANEDYWQEEVDVAPRMTFRIFTDPKTRVDSLITNQVDFAYQVGPGDAESLSLNSAITVSSDPSLRVRMIYLDLSDELIADDRVREALNLALDRDQMAEVGFFGYATAASTYFPAEHWASVDAEYPHDPERARELLREAGAEGAALSLLLPNDANTVRLSEILRQAYEDVGLTVNMQPRELVQSTTEYFDENRAPALLSAWTGRPDPAQTYAQLLAEAGYYNTGSAVTPGLEEAVDRSNEQDDQESRAEALQDAGRASFDYATFVPLVFEDTIVAYSNHVEGYEPNLLGKPKFTQMRETG